MTSDGAVDLHSGVTSFTGPPLVGLAHGSRDPRSARAVGELLATVAALRPGLVVTPAFLDLSEPDLTTAVLRLQVPRAVVLPLLFAQAFHATVDVPDAVREAAARSGTDLITGEILGVGPAVLAALQDRARDVGVDQEILLLAVGTSDPVANAVVADLAQRWSSVRQAPVRAVFATAVPRARDALAGSWTLPPAVVPLFLAPGLLLDQVGTLAAERGVTLTEPLGSRMAQLVLDRYDAALGPQVDGGSQTGNSYC